MIQLNETITISRSPGEVFEFLADLNNFPKWRANLVSFKILTAGPTEDTLRRGDAGGPHACDGHLRCDGIFPR